MTDPESPQPEGNAPRRVLTVNRRLAHSRWRRLPGLYRIGQRRMPGPDAELQRLSLYLPGGLLDRAEALATLAGAESVQTYCEQLLKHAIEQEEARRRLAQVQASRGAMEGLDAIANDPDYLVEWTASAGKEPRDRPAPGELPAPAEQHPPPGEPPGREAAALVLHHAALDGEQPPAFLASLRRGEPVDPNAARELLQALVDLEGALHEHAAIDRRLAFALHRLAFEAQVLVTDGWPALGSDAPTIETLRLVQEAVDRVLSGDDIRYYTDAPASLEPEAEAS
jgi:hypothetical protein